jgi:hypothetical protein
MHFAFVSHFCFRAFMLAGLIYAQSCLLLLQVMVLLLCATCCFISGTTNHCLKYPLKRLISCKPRSSIHFMHLLSCRCFYLLFMNSSSWAPRFSLFLVNAPLLTSVFRCRNVPLAQCLYDCLVDNTHVYSSFALLQCCPSLPQL